MLPMDAFSRMEESVVPLFTRVARGLTSPGDRRQHRCDIRFDEKYKSLFGAHVVLRYRKEEKNPGSNQFQPS